MVKWKSGLSCIDSKIILCTCPLQYISIYIYKSTPLLQESCCIQHLGDYSFGTLCVTPKYIQPWWYIPPNVEYTKHFRMLLKVVIEDPGCHGCIFCLVSVLSQCLHCAPTVWEYCRWSIVSYLGSNYAIHTY